MQACGVYLIQRAVGYGDIDECSLKEDYFVSKEMGSRMRLNLEFNCSSAGGA